MLGALFHALGYNIRSRVSTQRDVIVKSMPSHLLYRDTPTRSRVPSFCRHVSRRLSRALTRHHGQSRPRGSWIGRVKKAARKSIIESLDGESLPRQWYRRGIAPVTAPATVRGRVPVSGDLESRRVPDRIERGLLVGRRGKEGEVIKELIKWRLTQLSSAIDQG